MYKTGPTLGRIVGGRAADAKAAGPAVGWLRPVAAPSSPAPPLGLSILIGGCLALICLGSIAGILTPAGLGWDFANFYDAGRRAFHGQTADLYDPAAPIAGRPPQGHMAFFSAPITAYLYAPLAPLQPEAALIAFKVQNVLATWLALYLAWRRSRLAALPDPRSQATFTAAFLLLALLFQPFWTIFRSGGQSMPTVLLLLLLGWAAHENKRFWTSAGCFITAAAIKPFLAPGLVLLTAVSGASFMVAATAIALAAAGLSIALLGWPIHAAMLQKLATDAAAIVAPQYNSGLLSALDVAWLGPDGLAPGRPRPAALATCGLGVRAAVLAAFVWMAVRARRLADDDRAVASSRYMLAMLLPVFVTPVAWEHYLTLLFPAMALMAAGWRLFDRLPQALFLLVAAFSLGRNLIVMMWLNDRVGFATVAEQMTVSLFNSAPTLAALAWVLSAHAGLSSSLQPSLPRTPGANL